MTFLQDMANDATRVALNANEFARSITRYPLGVVANEDTLTAVFDQDEDNSAPSFSNEFGTRLIRQARLELAATVTVTCAEAGRTRDTFLIDSLLWGAVRIVGRDSAMQTVLIERQDNPTGSPPS